MFFEIIKRHIEDRTSYRLIQKRLRETTKTYISKSTIHNYLKEASLKCKTTIDVAKELRPKWTGYLHIDGKGIKIKGKRLTEITLFIAQDKSGDTVHLDLMEGENKTAIFNFFKILKEDIRYPFKGIISDMKDDIISAKREILPTVAHQFCITHMLRRIDELTNYISIRSQLSKLYKGLRILKLSNPLLKPKPEISLQIQALKKKILRQKKNYKKELFLRRKARILVLSNTLEKANNRFKSLLKLKSRYKQGKLATLIDSLIKHKGGLFEYLKHNKKMPSTNNLVENLIKQFAKRLKTIEGFGNINLARGYLNLLSLCYRFKPYTDCKEHHKYKNGKAPLELAKVKLTGLDWVRFAIK